MTAEHDVYILPECTCVRVPSIYCIMLCLFSHTEIDKNASIGLCVYGSWSTNKSTSALAKYT